MARKKVPSLCRHRGRAYGYCTLNGHEHYCGEWPDAGSDPPAETLARYNELISRWLAGGRMPLHDGESVRQEVSAEQGISVWDLAIAWLKHAQIYYRRTDGTPTSEATNVRYCMRALCHLYETLRAREILPAHLKAVRSLLVSGYTHPEYGPSPPCSRGVVNQRIAQIVRAFRWAAEEELIPQEVYLRLTTIRPLQKGRSEAKESEPVAPVSEEIVKQTLPFLTPHLQGAVRFQLLTGCRPAETLAVCLADMDRSGEVWLYCQNQHKTRHHGKTREVAIGPQGQQVLMEFIHIRCPVCGKTGRPPRLASLDGVRCGKCATLPGEYSRIEVQDPHTCLFHPGICVQEWEEDKRDRRRSKVQPSQISRRVISPIIKPGASYGTQAYCRAIARVCARHGIPPWHPNQLRHTRGTQVRKAYGLEGAQVALGHSQAKVTEIYAQRDRDLARKIARETG